jgi:hypothetical protein
MEQKSPKVSLDNLPPSTDGDFWDGEINTDLKPQRFYDDDHWFIRRAGREAQCTKCTWGFALDPGDKVENGHVYTRDSKLII